MNDCVFSDCGEYRYTLWRRWSASPLDQYLMIIGLNPSTADARQDDPTIRRCIDFANRSGFRALCMTNLFAWRDKEPAKMKQAKDPIGPENDYWLRRCAKGAGLIIAAWGRNGIHGRRDLNVIQALKNEGHFIHCLKTNANGTPRHPLYVPAITLPKIFA